MPFERWIRRCGAGARARSNVAVQSPETREVTDFISFYSLPSTIIGNTKYQLLKAAYSFYNVAGATPWVTLMNDALILAKKVRAQLLLLFAEV